jgi:cytochrome c biogenesis factor
MFLSALTRGGLLQSVHAYGLSPAGPFILLFGVVMIGCFFYLKINNAKPLFSIRFDRQLLSSWSVTLTLVCLVGIFLVCFSGIAYSMVARAIDTNAAVAGVAFYNYANFPFVIGLLFALIGFSLKSKAPLKLYIVLIFAIAISSGTLLLLGWPTNNNIANLGLPLIISSLFAAVVGFGSAIKSHRAPFLGRALIHFGLIVILLGVFISATSQQVTTLNAVRVGSTLEASGLTLSITDCNGCTDNNLIELSQGILPQSSNLLINTVVTDGKSTYNTGISVYLYSAYGLVSQPTIIRTGTDDIYIHLNITQEVYNSLLNSLVGNYSEPETFVVNVERIPMINLIWIGVSLLVIGGTINIISGIQRPKTRRKTT